MSSFPKSARHPSLLLQAEHWRTFRRLIDVHDESQLSDIPDLAIAARNIRRLAEVEYFQSVREILAANAVRALAKAYETLDAFARCESAGISVSAMIQAYGASFFAARAFCMLMGFSPLDRESSITVDAFSEHPPRRKGTAVLSEFLILHKYRRWGHEEVWKLTRRLVDTVQVPTDLQEAKQWLHRAKLLNSSKVRNSFHYDDRRLSPIENMDYVDFPDVVGTSIFGDDAPSALIHQFLVAKNLIQLCYAVLDKADIVDLLAECASQRRVQIVFNY